MPEGHDATIEVCNIMSFVLYTQILKQSVLKPASPGITLNRFGPTLKSDIGKRGLGLLASTGIALVINNCAV